MGNVLNYNITNQALSSIEMPLKRKEPLTNLTDQNIREYEDVNLSLITRAIRGDLWAIEKIYNEHYKLVFRIIYRLYPVREVAEEIANDTFFTAFRKLDTLKDHNVFRSWLLSIAVNNVRNRRRNERKKQYIEIDEQHPSNKDYNPVMKAALERAIADLSDGYRDVFLLHDADGFTHQEISKILNISEGTSKSQLFKARNTLKKMLLETQSLKTGEKSGGKK